MAYKQISIDDAKQIFECDQDGSYIILDVRRADEFAEGHIPGAINIANESIGSEIPGGLPDKNQVIYVYCRSGNRSKQAAEKLAALGYTNIIEFGGILDWKGEITATGTKNPCVTKHK
jgi:rhodanese-related sulfurtransferase